MRWIQNKEGLIRELQKEGISSPEILKAIQSLNREDFLPQDLKPFAYKNAPLAIGFQQTLSQPLMAALMTQYLEVLPGMKVLEIGTGSGYQTALLSLLGALVYSLERIEPLYRQAKERLSRICPGVQCFYRDGNDGLPEEAPFQRILATAAFEAWPCALEAQLCRENGILLFPLGGEWEIQRLVKVSFVQGQRFESYGDYCRLVPVKKDLMPG